MLSMVSYSVGSTSNPVLDLVGRFLSNLCLGRFSSLLIGIHVVYCVVIRSMGLVVLIPLLGPRIGRDPVRFQTSRRSWHLGESVLLLALSVRSGCGLRGATLLLHGPGRARGGRQRLSALRRDTGRSL